jgi:hypothetical protein
MGCAVLCRAARSVVCGCWKHGVMLRCLVSVAKRYGTLIQSKQDSVYLNGGSDVRVMEWASPIGQCSCQGEVLYRRVDSVLAHVLVSLVRYSGTEDSSIHSVQPVHLEDRAVVSRHGVEAPRELLRMRSPLDGMRVRTEDSEVILDAGHHKDQVQHDEQARGDVGDIRDSRVDTLRGRGRHFCGGDGKARDKLLWREGARASKGRACKDGIGRASVQNSSQDISEKTAD